MSWGTFSSRNPSVWVVHVRVCVCVSLSANRNISPAGVTGLSRVPQTALTEKKNNNKNVFNNTWEGRMLLCPRERSNPESQNSQDATCSIYVLWKTWLERRGETALLHFHCQPPCEVWGRGRGGWEPDAGRKTHPIPVGDRGEGSPNQPTNQPTSSPPPLTLPRHCSSLPSHDWRSVWSVPGEAQTQRLYLQDPH